MTSVHMSGEVTLHMNSFESQFVSCRNSPKTDEDRSVRKKSEYSKRTDG